MPCWFRTLPVAASFLYTIFFKSSFAAASMDFSLQSSNAIASRLTIMIPEIIPRQVQNVFINPPGDPSNMDFSNNPVYEVNSVVDIQWVMDGTVTEEVSLFLSVGINTSFAPTPQAIKTNPEGESFEWTVMNAFGALSEMFQLSIRIESSGIILFESQIFNVSETSMTGQSSDISLDSSASVAFTIWNTLASTTTTMLSTVSTEAPASEISSAAMSLTTSVVSSSPFMAPITSLGSATLSMEGTASTTTSNSLLSTTSAPAAFLGSSSGLLTTLLSQTSTSISTAPTTTSLSSNSFKSTNSNSPKRAEIALGSVLGIVLFSIIFYYLFRFFQYHPPLFKTASHLVLFKKVPIPINGAKLLTTKASTKLKAARHIPELEGVPIERAELDGGTREPVELDGVMRSKSVVSRVRHGIARTVVCPWRSSR